MKTLFSLIRVKQWIKSLFIFLPAFFGGVFLNKEYTITLLLGFILYSFMSSALYIINDINDVNFDKNHPIKKNRPIAAGKISIGTGYLIASILLLVSLIGSYLLNTSFSCVVLIYFLLNVCYSLGLKNISIVDIIIVALGFVFRIIAGGFLAMVIVSKWLFLLTFLLALFIVLAKRRDDLFLSNSRETIRKASKKYNLEFINYALIMVSSLTVVCYIMYTFSVQHFEKDNYYVFSTSLFVIMGMLRYYQIVFVENNSGSPTQLLFKDRFLQIVLFSWVSLFVIALYL